MDTSSDKKKETCNVVDEKGDYIFRFSVDVSRDGPSSDEPLVDFVRCQLADLLKVVILTENGKRVKIDGFRFLNNLKKEHKIWESRADEKVQGHKK